jgi:hypothetical protein
MQVDFVLDRGLEPRLEKAMEQGKFRLTSITAST